MREQFCLFSCVVIAKDLSLPLLIASCLSCGALEDGFHQVFRNSHGIAESMCTSDFFRAFFRCNKYL